MEIPTNELIYYRAGIPDIDTAAFWNRTRFIRIREVFDFLLNRTAGSWFPRFHDVRDRDLSTNRGKVEFLCDCFEQISWFATSYSSGIAIDVEMMIQEGENEANTKKMVEKRMVWDGM